jgi:hypothetical protein
LPANPLKQQFTSFGLYFTQMSKTAINSDSFYDQVFTLLAPEQCIIVDIDQVLVSANPAEKFDPDLFYYAKMLSKLPEPSWLHLVTLEDQPVFVLSSEIDQNQTAFLTFTSTTRITQMEEKRLLLQNALNNQTADPVIDLLQDLTTSDLKASRNPQPDPDDILSILAEVDESATKLYPKPPNQGDTQPISL